MTTPNERDEFERMRLVAQIERARGLVARYEVHQEFYRRQVEDSRYELGRLDERLTPISAQPVRPYPRCADCLVGGIATAPGGAGLTRGTRMTADPLPGDGLAASLAYQRTAVPGHPEDTAGRSTLGRPFRGQRSWSGQSRADQ
jgi:hypothetical protein